jgi:predicted methyltransferase
MSLTKTQQRILYSLGQCFKKLNQPYQDKPLKVFVSKIAFIELIKQADFIKKQERALYKNLEFLEKKKLIEYKDKKIKLTQRGQRFFNKIEKEIKPFVETRDFWHQNPKAERQLQTYMEK